MVENIIVAIVLLAAAIWAVLTICRKISSARKDDDGSPSDKCATCPYKNKD